MVRQAACSCCEQLTAAQREKQRFCQFLTRKTIGSAFIRCDIHRVPMAGVTYFLNKSQSDRHLLVFTANDVTAAYSSCKAEPRLSFSISHTKLVLSNPLAILLVFESNVSHKSSKMAYSESLPKPRVGLQLALLHKLLSAEKTQMFQKCQSAKIISRN